MAATAMSGRMEKPDSPPGGAATRGRLVIVASAVLWSLGGLFAKSPFFDDWPIETRGILLAMWRAAFASLVLATMVRRPVWDWRLLVAAAVFAVMNASYLTSMVYCEASLSIWLQYSAPLWVAAGSWWFLGEKLKPGERLPWAVSMFGVAVILAAELTQGSQPLGVALGLLSGVCFAGVVLTLRWLRHLDPAWIVLFNHALTAIAFSPVLISTGCWPHGSQWLLLAAFGMIQMGLPYLLFARSMKTVSSNEASTLLLLEPLLVPFWVWVAWRHHPDYAAPQLTTLIGGGLILLGLVLRYARKSPANDGEKQQVR